MKRMIREKRRKRGISRRRDGHGRAISNGDMMVNRVWRSLMR
jgi:hypothetical protein